MGIPPLKLWMLLIGVAALTLPLSLVVALIKQDAREEDFYGPGGVLQRSPRVWAEVMEGREALSLNRLDEAEARFHAALELVNLTNGPIPVDMRVTHYREASGALAGLADTLAARSRFAEAMPVYEEALSLYREGLGIVAPEANMSSDPEVAELLKRREACLREVEGRAVRRGGSATGEA